MIEIKNPVLPEHRAEFKKYLNKWQKLFGLQDWRVHFSSKLAPKGVAANVMCYYEARLARVRLGADFGDDEVTSECLESTARHELLHVLLYEITYAGIEETDTLGSAEHRVIHVLESLLEKEKGP